MAEAFGKFELLFRLGTGGMAEAHLARARGPVGFQKLLVVKRVLPHLSDQAEFVELFLDEARIAARLSHPNVVQIFDLGCIGGVYFIAMEYVHGETLSAVLRRAKEQKREVPAPIVARIVASAAD